MNLVLIKLWEQGQEVGEAMAERLGRKDGNVELEQVRDGG